jgi:hypothetical protein
MNTVEVILYQRSESVLSESAILALPMLFESFDAARDSENNRLLEILHFAIKSDKDNGFSQVYGSKIRLVSDEGRKSTKSQRPIGSRAKSNNGQLEKGA